MNAKPYIISRETATPVEQGQLGNVVNMCFINAPGQVSFGDIDYVPGWFIALHHHHTWELIIVDNSSEGPGYTFFDGRWWRANPGSGIFFPKNFPHAWSAANNTSFKMLWVYGGSHEEADRIFDVDPECFSPISSGEEAETLVWSPSLA